MAILFWSCLLVLIYIYAGYPFLISLLVRWRARPVRRVASYTPTVTVVISAYNEEKSIRAKLENVLSLAYPIDRLDVIVASDGSTDATDRLVACCGLDRVRLMRVEGRRGKTACQNAAAAQATGEILVFTDATTHIVAGALAAIVENFADPEVGCVAGLLVYQAQGENATAAGGVTYWSYELRLRHAESRLGTLIGVSGCLYAVRRCAYRPMAPQLISDFVIAMCMREQGLRTVLDERAVCYEETLDHSRRELPMRVRVAVRSIAALIAERRFLSPLRDPLFAWQLWSHKLLRYLAPYFALGVLVSSIALSAIPVYGVALLLQLVLIAAGAAGFALQSSGHSAGVLSKPYYLLLTNIASVIATMRYAAGERMVTWTPVR